MMVIPETRRAQVRYLRFYWTLCMYCNLANDNKKYLLDDVEH